MSEHRRVFELLPLAAAGVLDPQEERMVQSHAAECETCAAELRIWQSVGAELGRLPAPVAPPAVVAAAHRKMDAALAAHAARPWDEVVMAVLALFGWTVGLSMWAVLQILRGGYAALSGTGWAESLGWLTATTVVAWLTAGAVAILANQRRKALWRQL